MTYIVNENCIKCKFTDCVEVCPVDCFYEGENMLVIHPDECIDCGVCEPECPVDAIKPDTEPGLEQWLELKSAASDTILAAGGTITHHHAVGRDHRRWYDGQRPEPFAAALRAAKAAVDPRGILNPGVLLDR